MVILAYSYDDPGTSITHGKIGLQGYTGAGSSLKSRFDNILVKELCAEYYAYLPLIVK